MNNNPFEFGRPVKGKDFYNRREEIETAIGFIKNLQCFSVVGERRIGKTSFLQHLLSEEVFREHAIDPRDYILIYINVGSLHEITKNTFIETIIKKIREKFPVKIEHKDIFEELVTYMEKIAFEGKNLVLAFDEFECIAPILDSSSFSHWLRFIFLSSHVMAITASRTTIGELEKCGDSASPLSNVFGNLFLGLFRRTETENMIKELFEKGGIGLDEQEIAFLADLSGGNPYFIQLIGFHYYEEKRRIQLGNVDRINFTNQMIIQTNNQFESYWKHLENGEKGILMDVSMLNELKKSDHFIEQILRRKGFTFTENGEIKIFSPLFYEFIQRKCAYKSLPGSVPLQEKNDVPYIYDVFICHASEDKEPFVRKLAEKLSEKGLNVWYDEFTLHLGNNLKDKIDYGLARSRYGIIVLSKDFFNKNRLQEGLNTLSVMESETTKIILLIPPDITEEKIRSLPPTLANRLIIPSEEETDNIANKILKILGKSSDRKKERAANEKYPLAAVISISIFLMCIIASLLMFIGPTSDIIRIAFILIPIVLLLYLLRRGFK